MSNVMATQQAGGAGGIEGLMEHLFKSSPLGGLIGGVAKVGESLLSGDFLSVVQGGAQQLLGPLFEQLPAFQTEYVAFAKGGGDGGWAAGFAAVASGGAGEPGAPAGPGGGTAPAPGTTGAATHAASAGTTTGTSATGVSSSAQRSSLARDLADYERALKTIDQHYTLFSSRLDRDAHITVGELQTLAKGKNTAPELKEAAQFLLDHPEFLQRLLSAVPPVFGWRDDDTFGKLELFNELTTVQQERRALEAGTKRGTPGTGGPGTDCAPPAPSPPAPTEPPTCGTPGPPKSEVPTDPPSCEAPPSPGDCGAISRVLSDASLSVEDKLKRVMMLLTTQIDDELLDVMAELDGASAKRADVTAKGASATTEEKASLKRQETDQQFLQLRLQELMERRKAMFELMSNLSASFHAMSRVAISNLGRA